MASRDVCVIAAVCEEDARWLPQFLADLDRLALPLVLLLDRCSDETHRLAVGYGRCEMCVLRRTEDGEFDERCKQPLMDLAGRLGFRYALAMDVDETFERDAGPKIAAVVAGGRPLVKVRWFNVWGEDGSKLRTDGPFLSGGRVKFYNLHDFDWRFLLPTVNGAYAHTKSGRRVNVAETQDSLATLHWGMSTPELCELHKRRWDRIYGRFAAGGKNPYGFWDYACDPATVPILVDNPYL